MVNEQEKTTVPIPSVGADGEQPISNNTNGIITADPSEINYPNEISEEKFDELQGRLENEYGIDYQSVRTHSGRIIILKRVQPSP